jgi:hypothetical protein
MILSISVHQTTAFPVRITNLRSNSDPSSFFVELPKSDTTHVVPDRRIQNLR